MPLLEQKHEKAIHQEYNAFLKTYEFLPIQFVEKSCYSKLIKGLPFEMSNSTSD